jgi:hypothetical protein
MALDFSNLRACVRWVFFFWHTQPTGIGYRCDIRRIQIWSDDPIRDISDLGRPRSDIGWTSSRLWEELIGSWKISDPISDLGRPISGLGRPISGLRRPISGLERPRSGLGRPILGLGRPRSDIGWTSSRLREELIGSRKISDPISDSDVRPDQIWIHLLGVFGCPSTIVKSQPQLRKT